MGAKKIFRRKIKGVKVPYQYPTIKPYIPNEENLPSKEIGVYIGEDEEGEIYIDREMLKKAFKDNGLFAEPGINASSNQKSKKNKESKYEQDSDEEFELLQLNLSKRFNRSNREEEKVSPKKLQKLENLGPIAVQSNLEDDKMAVIYDLIRKKQLKRIRTSVNSEDEFFTCRDQSEIDDSSSTVNNNDIEVYMVKPVAIEEHDDSSSIYDSDDDDEESKDSADGLFETENISDDQDPNIDIHTMGKMKNKFKKKKKNKKDKKRKRKDSDEEEKRLDGSEPLELTKASTVEDPELMKKRKRIQKAIENIQPVQKNDDYRIPDAHSSGGFALLDKEVISKYRSVAKEVLKRVGSQLLRGKVNLTSISFPIKCMGKLSHLQALSSILCVFPSYLTFSSMQTDPVERMKWFLVAMISSHTATHHFDKPLNPILGETYTCECDDGSIAYCEQTSHKPPVTHAQFYGPNNCYVLSMYTGFAAKAGFNSITLNCVGKKSVDYIDGTRIYCNTTPGDIFGNTFFGTLNHQFTGKIEYIDDINNIYAVYTPGARRKVQDYIEGYIEKDGARVCDISGTYCGYLEFDDVRYWDVRDTLKFDVRHRQKEVLPSDSRYRTDLMSLIEGDVSQAQTNKEQLEQDQRHDAKLRGHH